MPVQVEWFQKEHVLIARYEGVVTPEDILYQYTVGIEMSEGCNTPMVHMIADVTAVTSFPTDFGALRKSFGEKARNAGWVVIVGENRLVRFVSTVVSNLMKLRFSYVNTIEEAVTFIQDRDPSVRGLSGT